MATKPFTVTGNVGIGTNTVTAGTRLMVSRGNINLNTNAGVQTGFGIVFSDGTFLNSANLTANGSSYSSSYFTYTGDGTTTAYSTGSVVASGVNNTMVYINGVYQRKTTYTWVGTTITFNAAPDSGDFIELNVVQAISGPLSTTDLTITGNLAVNGAGTNTFQGNVGIGTSAVSGSELAVYTGNIKIGSTGTGIVFPDGTFMTTAASGTSNYGNTNVASYLSGPVQVGNLYIAYSTVSTSTTSGSLVTAGGAGIAGNVYVGGNLQLTTSGFGIRFPDGTYQTTAASGTGNYSNANVASYLSGPVTVGNLFVANTTASTSTATGAEIVAGGVGIAGNLNVGGSHSLFTNKLGIGTSSALGASANTMTVYGTATIVGNLQLANTSGTSMIMFSDGTYQTSASNPGGNTGAIQFKSASGAFAGDATNFYYDSTNYRLGIGTGSTTTATIYALGPVPTLLNTLNGSDPQVIVGPTTAIGAALGFNTTNNYSYLRQAPNGTDLIRLTTTGVGINAVSPTNTMDISGRLMIGGGAAYAGSGTAPANGLMVQGAIVTGTSTAPGAGIQFQVGGTNSSLFGGSVGVGTASTAGINSGSVLATWGNIQIQNNTTGRAGIWFPDGTFLNSGNISVTGTGYTASYFSYTGDGTTTAYSTGSATATSVNNTMVYISGVYQRKSTYTWVGTTLTFNAPPANFSLIEINVVQAVSGPVSTSDLTLSGNLTVNGTGTSIFQGNVGIGTATVNGSELAVYTGNIKIGTAGTGLVFPDGTVQTTAASGTGNYSNTNVASYLSGPVTVGNLFVANTTVSTSTASGAIVIAGGVGIAGNINVGGANSIFTGDIAVNGGDITTTSAAATLFNATATTVNVAAVATSIGIGSTTGTLTIRNPMTLIGGSTNTNTYLEIGKDRSADGQALVRFYSGTSNNTYGYVGRQNGINGDLEFVNQGSGSTIVWQSGTGPILLGTSGTERMRITPSGTIGIGTVSTLTNTQLGVYGGNLQIGTSGSGLVFPDGTFMSTAAFGTGTGNYSNTNVASYLSGPVVVGNLFVANSTVSTSATTGAFVAAGGAGIGGNLYVTGNVVTSTGFFAGTGQTQRTDTSYDIATSNNIWAGGGLNLGSGVGGGSISFSNGSTPAVIKGVPGLFGYMQLYVNNDLANNQIIYGNTTGMIVGNGTDPATKLDVRGNSRFSQNLSILTTNVSTSTTTGAFTVAGGAGIAGNVYVGGNVQLTTTGYGIRFADGTYQTTAATGSGTGNYSNTNVASYLSGPVQVGNLFVANTTVSTSTTSGAFVAAGGAGIAGNVYVGGNVNVVATTSSTSATTGAIVTAGGLGVGGEIYGSNSLTLTGASSHGVNFITTNGYNAGSVKFKSTNTFSGASALSVFGAISATDSADSQKAALNLIKENVSSTSLMFAFYPNGFGPGSGGLANASVIIRDVNTQSTSTDTGSLVVTGGAGITGNINVGGTTNSFSGNVGVGTTSVLATTRLGVYGGNIQVGTSGFGIRFADGTLQTTAATSSSGGGIGVYSPLSFSYTGDGVTTTYSTAPVSGTVDYTYVYVGGVYQRKSTYTWSGTNITFSSAPPNLSPIEINVIQSTASNVSIYSGSVGIGTSSNAGITTGNILAVWGNVNITGSYLVNGVPLTAGLSVTNDVATNANTYYPSLTNNVTSGTLSSLVTSSTKLFYNPSTGALNSGVFIPSSSTAPSSGLFLPAANTLGFATNSTEGMRLDSSSRLQIGYTAPSTSNFNENLTVKGNAKFGDRTQSSSLTMIGYADNPNVGAVGTISNHPFYLLTDGSVKVRITAQDLATGAAGGNVYINTTATPLSSNSRVVIGHFNNSVNSDGGGLQMSGGDAGGVQMTPINGGGVSFSSYTGAVGSETYAERVRINSAGNVGIGTSIPVSTLDVNGNVNISGTGRRFFGDFSNATITNRTAFQTSTVNAATGIYALPNGSSTAASWQATNAADPTNASKILIATNGSTDVQLVSGINGSGTYLPLTFYNGGAERMRIDIAGNVGIGTSTVTAPTKLYVQGGNVVIGGAGYGIRFPDGTFQSTASTGSGGVSVSNDISTNSNNFYPLLSNNTTSGTLSAVVTSNTDLYFNPSTGTLNAIVFNSLSDLNKKTDVRTITDGSDILAGIRGVRFNWIDNGKPSAGLIAQEVESVMPELVSENDNGTKSLNYNGIIGVLVETIKELKSEIRTLHGRISKLEERDSK